MSCKPEKRDCKICVRVRCAAPPLLADGRATRLLPCSSNSGGGSNGRAPPDLHGKYSKNQCPDRSLALIKSVDDILCQQSLSRAKLDQLVMVRAVWSKGRGCAGESLRGGVGRAHRWKAATEKVRNEKRVTGWVGRVVEEEGRIDG